MSILDIQEYRQAQPIEQFLPVNPGSYNDFVSDNNLDSNRDHLPKYTKALITYNLGVISLIKEYK